jgi:cytochrome oxidase Cu insertion factor (SCO1/SenC/PrrC family)
MKNILSILLSTLLIVIYCCTALSQTTHPEPKTLEPGARAPDFNLPGVDGKMYSLKSFEKAQVVVIIFSCNHCPTAQAYEDRIIALSGDYKQKGVEVVMISPNAIKGLNYSELGYSDMGDSFCMTVMNRKPLWPTVR